MDIFDIQTKVISGEGALEKIKDLGIVCACVICDPFLAKSGKIDLLLKVLREGNIRYHVFSDIVQDPSVEVVVQGIVEALRHQPDAIIAVGGGSAIDTAKAVSYFYTDIKGVPRLLGIAVPTTSGTGSEVTSFSVISDRIRQIKYPLHHKTLLPDVAVLEPELVSTQPPAVTADTGLDAMTHALEAFVSSGACDFSDAFAEKALRYVFRYLPDAFHNPGNMAAWGKLLNASCMAGMAFNHAGVGLTHSMAHALGAIFHIPHGRANAILLPYVVRYNGGLMFSRPACAGTAERYAYLAKTLGLPACSPAQGTESLVRAILSLRKELGIPRGLREHGLEEKAFLAELEALVKAALGDICTQVNPVRPAAEDIREIFLRCYAGRQ